MASALALVVYALLLAPAALAVWRRPIVALYAFLVGLAFYNLVMAFLWGAGMRGGALEAIQAWKEILLGVAIVSVAARAVRARALPFRPRLVDGLALIFGTLVVLYALLPQGPLGGEAGAKAVVYALRHDLTPVAAYLVGRSVVATRPQLRALGWTLLASAAVVATVGLVDQYTVPVSWWRDSGAVGFFHDQQGYDYHGPGGLPENFVYNSSEGLFRRLTSVFLSPLGAAYMLAAALLAVAAGGPFRRRPRLVAALGVLCAAALLFTLSRSTIVALAGGLVVLALALRRGWPVLGAAAVIAAGIGFSSAFPSIAPRTHYFPADVAYQEAQAKKKGGLPQGSGILSPNEPSFKSHLVNLRDGLRTVGRHPQGYGLGNAGVTALRFDTPLKAGESTYTELGVETGIVGMVAFVAWSLALLAGLVRSAWSAGDETERWAAAAVAAAFAAVLALAVQTDVLGVLWLAFTIWWIGGTLLERAPAPVVEPAPSREPRPLVQARL